MPPPPHPRLPAPRPGISFVVAAAAALQLGPAALAIPPLTRYWTRACRPAAGAHVALTFDDGPHPHGTPAVLEVLADFEVSASFFVVGEQAERHPDLIARIAAAGHGVELHGYRHRLLVRRSPIAARADIRLGYRTVHQLSGRNPQWFRPAYGTGTGPALGAAHRLGMTPVWWSSEGQDWRAGQGPVAITDRIVRRLDDGRLGLDHRDVLLLHDSDAYAATGSWRATVAALPRILSDVHAAGLTVGPLPRSARRPD